MMKLLSVAILLMSILTPGGQPSAQYCNYTNAPDIDGEYKPRPEPEGVYCDESSQEGLVVEDPENTVLIHFADALEGADWDELLETSPAHALFFVGAKAKGDLGESINVRDWHVAVPFLPTEAIVRMFQNGTISPLDVEQASGKIKPNQSLRIEARGRSLDSTTVELNLTTVLETALNQKEKSQEVFESRMYYLTRTDGPSEPDVGSHIIAF